MSLHNLHVSLAQIRDSTGQIMPRGTPKVKYKRTYNYNSTLYPKADKDYNIPHHHIPSHHLMAEVMLIQ